MARPPRRRRPTDRLPVSGVRRQIEGGQGATSLRGGGDPTVDSTGMGPPAADPALALQPSQVGAAPEAPRQAAVGLLDVPTVGEGAGPPSPPPPPAPEPGMPVGEQHPAAGADGLNPEFSRRLNALFAASGGRVYAGSGYRSYEQQAALYQEAVAKYGAERAGHYAAPPGESNHNRGLAMDIKGDFALAEQLAPQFGLFFPMDHEPWHIEPAGLRQDPSTPPTAYTAPGVKEAPMKTRRIRDGQRLVTIPVEAMALAAAGYYDNAVAPIDFTAGQVTPAQFSPPEGQNPARHLGEQQLVQTPAGTPKAGEGVGPPPPEPVAEPGQEAAASGGGDANTAGGVEDWITEALRISGKPESWRAPLRALVMRESGGNPQAQNNWDSNAKKGTPSKGLVQFIDPTFASQHWPGYGDIWNPVHSLLAGIRRIDITYGGDVNSVGYRKGGY